MLLGAFVVGAFTERVFIVGAFTERVNRLLLLHGNGCGKRRRNVAKTLEPRLDVQFEHLCQLRSQHTHMFSLDSTRESTASECSTARSVA